MSVVIVGGHDRMVCQYKKICKEFKQGKSVYTDVCKFKQSDRFTGSDHFIYEHRFT